MTDCRPLAAVLIPACAVPLILLSPRRPNFRESWILIAAALELAVVFSLLPDVLSGGFPEFALGLGLSFRADASGVLFALMTSIVGIATAIYSAGALQTGHFACLAACLSAGTGVAFAANPVTFFVFFELLALSSAPLIVQGRTTEAQSLGKKYTVFAVTGGLLLLTSLGWTHAILPGADFRPGGFLSSAGVSPEALRALLLLSFAGICLKAAVPALAGEALIPGATLVNAAAFACLRLTGFVFGPDLLRESGADSALALLAAAMMLVGPLRALRERDLERRLAWSTAGSLCLVILGAALGSAAALAGAIFYVAAHAFLKLTLCFCAASLRSREPAGGTPASGDGPGKFTGLGRRFPATAAAFGVAALCLTGAPPGSGFVSAWSIGLGAVHSGHEILLFALAASSVLNAAAVAPFIHAAYFEQAGVPSPEAGLPAPVRLAPALTAAASLTLGLRPDAFTSFYSLAWTAAASITGVPAPG